MTNFNWNGWLGQVLARPAARKPRRSRVSQIEGLENRALLTANLPVAVADTYSVDQDTTLTATTAVLANDTDADGDTISEAVLQNTVTNGSLTLNTNGTFTYIPNAGFIGSDTFTYFARDAANGEQSATAATVTITVTANVAPVVSPVSLTGTVNTAVTGTLTGTDADGDTLTFAEGATAETNGTVVINSDGTFTFTPTTDFTGTATFSYRANDGSLNSSDATVEIVVSAINTAPVVINGTGTTPENSQLNGSLVSLATDAQGDALTFAVGIQPANGTVVVNSNGTFAFTPNTDFVGTTSFTFTASDGLLTSLPATFTVTVTAVDAFDLNLADSVTISNNPSSPTALDSAAALVNVAAGTNFANAQVDASFVSGLDSKKDRLVVIKKNGDVRVKGKQIFFNNTQVATITSGNKKGSALSISFNSSATEASVEAVLQSIAIQTRPSASTSVRVIQFQVTADGTTGTDTIEASIG